MDDISTTMLFFCKRLSLPIARIPILSAHNETNSRSIMQRLLDYILVDKADQPIDVAVVDQVTTALLLRRLNSFFFF